MTLTRLGGATSSSVVEWRRRRDIVHHRRRLGIIARTTATDGWCWDAAWLLQPATGCIMSKKSLPKFYLVILLNKAPINLFLIISVPYLYYIICNVRLYLFLATSKRHYCKLQLHTVMGHRYWQETYCKFQFHTVMSHSVWHKAYSKLQFHTVAGHSD